MASDDKFTASGKEGDLVILLDTSSEPLPSEKGMKVERWLLATSSEPLMRRMKRRGGYIHTQE